MFAKVGTIKAELVVIKFEVLVSIISKITVSEVILSSV